MHIFAIPSSSRHEKHCQMLQRLFWLFQCSRNTHCRMLKKVFWQFLALFLILQKEPGCFRRPFFAIFSACLNSAQKTQYFKEVFQQILALFSIFSLVISLRPEIEQTCTDFIVIEMLFSWANSKLLNIFGNFLLLH